MKFYLFYITSLTFVHLHAEKYDFIIVGAGSSGCVIANRLSEIPSWKILLLEAGDTPDTLSEVPLLLSFLQLGKYNWNYLMEYQAGVAKGCKNDRMPWPKGRALGGSSVINYMIYTRGNKFMYDKWASNGNSGWSYEEVLPYFKKSENATIEKGDNDFHGSNGYLKVEDGYQSKISEGFIKGLEELGLQYIDYNSNKSLGVSKIQATTFKGRRFSVTKGFIDPFRDIRTNLKIVTRALVTKILINPKTKEAYGVEYILNEKKYKVGATKEVILSAGSISSPQILMLSGIGPQKHLQELGIPLVKNLSVGQNLEDHLGFLGLSFTTPHHVTITSSDIFNLQSMVDFVYGGTGPLTCVGGVQALAYVKTDPHPENYPNFELIFAGASLALDFGFSIRQGMGIKDDVYNAYYAPLENRNAFMILPMLLTPKSKGYIKLRSTNPFDYPLLYGNYLTDPQNQDLKSFVKVIRFVQKLLKTKSFRQFGVTFNKNRVPGCENFHYDSDNYWKCALRSLAQTLHHQIGTAKMGPKNDPGAVVDNKLRVYGVRRLRVADCSVVPSSVGAHMNAPAIMIGEKAADLIKKTWGV